MQSIDKVSNIRFDNNTGNRTIAKEAVQCGVTSTERIEIALLNILEMIYFAENIFAPDYFNGLFVDIDM